MVYDRLRQHAITIQDLDDRNGLVDVLLDLNIYTKTVSLAVNHHLLERRDFRLRIHGRAHVDLQSIRVGRAVD